MSQTIISLIIGFLAYFLPKWGVVIGNETLTSTAQTIVIIVSGLWIYWRRVQKGDVTLAGVRK